MPSPSSLNLLIEHCRPHRRQVILALLALCVASGAALALPVGLRLVVDHALVNPQPQDLDGYFMLFLFIVLVMAIATTLRFYLMTELGERVAASLRTGVHDHLLTLDLHFYETTPVGEVLSRLTADVGQIQNTAGYVLSMALRNVVTLFGALVMLVFTSPYLALLVSLGIPLLWLPLIRLSKHLRQVARESQDRLADTSARANEVLQAISLVQAFTQEARESARYHGAVTQSYQAAIRYAKFRSLLILVVILLSFTAVVGVLWVGAYQVMDGELSPGELGQFLLYAAFLAGAARNLGEVWGELQRLGGATGRLAELLATRASVAPPPDPITLSTPVQGALRLQEVSFYYPSRPEQMVIENLSLHIQTGETVALVGPSGAGKSTLFRLLLRFSDPTHGRIYLDEHPIQRLAPRVLRQQFALVPQDTVVFADTVEANIRYGRPDASITALHQAAQAAHIHDFIMSQPEGYQTFLGERGLRLSGGQRQRLSIARAMLRDPAILLLDEATSHLDAIHERQVQAALASLCRDRTTLIIAHRLSTVYQADRIVVLVAGRIVAVGQHDNLLASSEIYRQLVATQLSSATTG